MTADNTIKPVGYADPQSLLNLATRGGYAREWLWASPDPVLAPLYDQATIDALRAEVEGWKAQHVRDSAELRSLCAARDEARARAERAEAEAAALREDAERYRYVRRSNAWEENYLHTPGGISAVFVSDGRMGTATDTEALDAAIDAARAGGEAA